MCGQLRQGSRACSVLGQASSYGQIALTAEGKEAIVEPDDSRELPLIRLIAIRAPGHLVTDPLVDKVDVGSSDEGRFCCDEVVENPESQPTLHNRTSARCSADENFQTFGDIGFQERLEA